MHPLPGSTHDHDLHLTAPIDRWDEAIALGNGLTGALLWGDRHSIKLSLDRGDVWDNRLPEEYEKADFKLQTLLELIRRGDEDQINKQFRRVAGPGQSKLPTCRLELNFDDAEPPQAFDLDLRRATGSVTFLTRRVEAFCCATQPIVCVRVTGAAEPSVRFVPPLPPAVLDQRGYGRPQYGSDGNAQWLLMSGHEQFRYAAIAASRRAGDTTLLVVAVVTSTEATDCVALGRQRVERALDQGYDAYRRDHEAWWSQFWSASALKVPDTQIERHYYLTQYLYGSASRRGAPPIALQGVWTADEGTMPPWRGDYHHDLNTQLTYWAYLSAGHFEEGHSFLDLMWDVLPRHRALARDFFGTGGAVVPGQMALDGSPVPGYADVTFAMTMGAWVAHAFYLHWRYTMDRTFLAERAYPYCQAIAKGLAGLLEPGEDGKLKLPYSSSPEVYGGTIETWMTPNTNFDLTLMRWLFAALAEMADQLHRGDEAVHWRDMLTRLDDLEVGDTDMLDRPADPGPLLVAPGSSLSCSHRHHSHMIAIHPFDLITIEGSDRDRQIIDQTLKQITYLGYHGWVGFSFAWMACIAARCGRPQQALLMLELYLRAFVSRNGFHLNGDYKDTGLSLSKHRPFTLEGNFAAAQALHEMLLQSWGGTVRVFPAVPDCWCDAAFDDLRAEGGFRVWARRCAGRTTWLRVTATVDGTVRLRDPFRGGCGRWNRNDMQRDGNDWLCRLSAGESLEAETADKG